MNVGILYFQNGSNDHYLTRVTLRWTRWMPFKYLFNLLTLTLC